MSGDGGSNVLRFSGARTGLGLDVRWRYSFVAPGDVVGSSSDTVFVDVGGRLEPGIIDHHHAGPRARSSAGTIVACPALVYEHLVGPWITADRTVPVRGRVWSPLVVMHRAPDFDSIVSASLIKTLVECGGVTARDIELARYADDVDGGYERPALPEACFQLYPLVLMLQHMANSGRRGDDTGDRRFRDVVRTSLPPSEAIQATESDDALVLHVGMHLVRVWMSAAENDPAGGWAGRRTELRHDPIARQLAACLEKDVARFRGGLSRYRNLGKVRVPSAEGGTVALHAAVLHSCGCEKPTCECDMEPIACDKIYMRLGVESAGVHATPLTVIEKTRDRARIPSGDGRGVARHRWIVAIDPHSVDARGETATLEGLGASLEWAEQSARRAKGCGDAVRSGATRFAEFPGVRDPWYDGRGHGYTIIDSPLDGSVLTRDEVLSFVRSEFWDPLCEAVRVWRWDFRDRKLSWTTDDVFGDRRLRATLADAGGKGYVIAVVRIRSGWTERRHADAIRDFVSGRPEPVELSVGSAYVGPRGTVVSLKSDAPMPEFGLALGTVLELDDELRRIEQDAMGDGQDGGESDGGQGARKTVGKATGRELRRQFIHAIANYHSKREGESADDRALRRAIEAVLHIDRRREGTGDLLQLLDHNEQEASDWRLNRLAMVLAIAGALQTGVAVAEAFEAFGTPDMSGVRLGWHVFWVVVATVVSVFIVSMAVPWCQRYYAGTSRLGPYFPEYAIQRRLGERGSGRPKSGGAASFAVRRQLARSDTLNEVAERDRSTKEHP